MRARRRSTSVDQHFSKSLLCASRTVSEEGGGLNELDVAVLAISAVDLFVCLFVCLDKTRKSILRSLCLEGSNNPWEWLHTDLGTDHVLQSKTSAQTKYVSIDG